MNKISITFANNETLELSEGQLITPIVKCTDKDNSIFASQDTTYELWNHVHDGLIPSVLEMLFSCEYFRLLDDSSKVYNSKAIVNISIL